MDCSTVQCMTVTWDLFMPVKHVVIRVEGPIMGCSTVQCMTVTWAGLHDNVPDRPSTKVAPVALPTGDHGI